jgi:adenylate cyclase class 2
LGLDAAVLCAGCNAGANCDADPAVLADRAVTINRVWHSALDHVGGIANLSSWNADVRQAGIDSGSVSLGEASMIEVEKKFRLTKRQRDTLARRLPEVGASLQGEEFEENTLYDGEVLKSGACVLRLRRVGGNATLTYKKRLPGASSIKQQREEETRVADPEAMEAILEALGFTPSLVYEKRRQTWVLGKTEIVIDVLPFGLFMEIEGRANDIRAVERKLGLKGLRAEHATYPQLTQKHGKHFEGLIEARF